MYLSVVRSMVVGDHVDVLRISFHLCSTSGVFGQLQIVLLGYGLPKRMFPLSVDDSRLHKLQGVYANLTIQLGNAFDSKPLRVWGAICATGTLLLWLSIVLRSIVEIKNLIKIHGVLADSPHLTEELKQDSPPESGWTNSTITHNEQV